MEWDESPAGFSLNLASLWRHRAEYLQGSHGGDSPGFQTFSAHARVPLVEKDFYDAGSLTVWIRIHYAATDFEVENPDGSLVPPGFGARQGTAEPLMNQTCMNEQPKLKQLCGTSSADARRRARIVNGAKRTASQRQSSEPIRPMAALGSAFHPARGLMICMGWLRLFQAIVSDGLPSARGPFPDET